MYIADRIAVQLKLKTKERKIVRLAGLLHDIGHYPLSHLCEIPYKSDLEDFPESDHARIINNRVDVVEDKQFESVVPPLIRRFCKLLLNHKELKYIDGSELKIISKNDEEIKKYIVESKSFSELGNLKNSIAIFSSRNMSRQTTEKEFKKYLKSSEDDDDVRLKDSEKELRERRFMECVTVSEKGERLHLLCDDERSLMKWMYDLKTAILRVYSLD